MTRNEFLLHKSIFVKLLRSILQKEQTYATSEAAFNAYAHKNPLISFLFWERLWKVIRYLEHRQTTRIIDFGCGSGVD